MKSAAILKMTGLCILLMVGGSVMAGNLTTDEIQQIETDLGITLSQQEMDDLGAIVKPDTIAAWRSSAVARIESYRKADLQIQVEDAHGNPVPGAQVAVKLNKNAFKFGGVASVADVTDSAGSLSTEGQTTAYWKNTTSNLFNAVGLNNGFKPKLTSQHAEIPGFMDWATNNNLDVRAHLLMWPGGGDVGDLGGTPGTDYGAHLSRSSTSAYASHNVLGAVETYAGSPQEPDHKADLKAEIDAEIAEWAGRWNVYEWDVINETRGNNLLQQILGYDQEAEWFNIASNNMVNPEARLFINENQIISAKSAGLQSGYYTDKRDIYYTTIDRLVTNNAPIHGVGFQNRYKWEHIDPADVYSRLDEFGNRYGLQLAGTEFEIKHQPPFTPSEYTRAQMTEETMTVYYSHALATGLNAWNFMSASPAVSSDTNEWSSAMAWYDGTIKLNGLAWYYVHRLRYNTETNETTDATGTASVPGAFKGEYNITVTYNGTDYPAAVTLSSNQTAVVALDVIVVPSVNPPVFTVDPISEAGATEGTAYTGQSITNSATDADGDTLTYSKVLGPAWLSIASTGDLSGTPSTSDAGQNSWIVQVSDGFHTDTAVLSIIVTGSGGGGASPVTVNVSEDQFIHANEADTVQDLDTRLDTRNSAHSFSRIPYLKFVTGSLPGTIASATLNLYSESELDLVNALAVANSSWLATTLTWNNAPSRGSLIIGSGQASSSNSWFTIDVTSHITGAGTFSIALDEQGNTSRDYLASSRSSNGAYLYITFTGEENTPPVFDNNPIIKSGATQDAAFSDAIAGNAADADLDEMTFDMVSGPSWLHVETNGVLSGTPLVGDLGSNGWQVLVTDGTATNFANLQIVVSEPLQIVSPQSGTNVLFIAIDDMKPLLGCYGDPFAISPNIDSLADAGVTFLNAQCQWAVCGPSRASISTGLYPEETGVMGFKTMRGNSNQVRPNLVTMQQWFRYNGYRTAATGKINDPRCVGSMDAVTGVITADNTVPSQSRVDDPPSWGDPVDPNNLPADFFTSSSYVPTPVGGWSPAGKPSVASNNAPDSAFTDGMICDVGTNLLATLAAGDTQFFLGVGFKKPHLAFVAPQQYWDYYDRSDFDIHPFQEHPKNEVPYSWKYATELAAYDEFYNPFDPADVPINGRISCTNVPPEKQLELIHGYYACASFIDAQIGRLLDQLEALNLHTNTIVVVWGDHGFHLGDHAEWAKHTNLEQAARVLLIIYSPFTGVAGAKPTSPASFVDIYPTLCELAGLPIPEQPLAENEGAFDPASGRALKGISLAPVMQDPDVSVRTGALTLFSRDGAMGYSYRTERYRYIEWIDGGVVARELYDYELDPMETINLAGESGYDALMLQYSQSMRTEMDALALIGSDIACAELQGSPALDTTSGDYSLAGLESALSGSNLDIRWPDAAGWSYNVMTKTNLNDAAWTVEQTGVPGDTATVATTNPAAFFRIELAP